MALPLHPPIPTGLILFGCKQITPNRVLMIKG